MKSIFKLSGHQRMVDAKHGIFIYNHNDHYVGTALELYGEYAEHEVDLFRALLSSEDHVIEVGANIGAHTVPIAKFLSDGMVHAFEPQPVVFQNLCGNLSANCIDNVFAWPFGVGEKQGAMIIPHIDYGKHGNFGSISLMDSGEGVSVQIITLDNYSASLDVALLKIDVEGMEIQVIAGAEGLIRRCRPLLYVENDRLENSQALIEKCWGLDYTLYWHAPLLFNSDNHFGNKENIYGNVAAFNMLGIPNDRESSIQGLQKIVDSSKHPLKKSTD